MSAPVKAPLRPFEYMAWAHSVPQSARYNLTASGVEDAVTSGAVQWTDSLATEELCRRDPTVADELIHAVARRYDLGPDCVTPTLGASLAIMQAMMAVIRAGDHVIVERPTYEALYRVPEILGASVSRLERKMDEGWNVMPDRLAKLLTPRTRAVVLSSLHNPSGTGIDHSTLKEVADLADRVGATVMVDEVYLDFCFGQQPYRPACLVAENAVSWSSATKCFGFSAIRAGWIVASDPDLSSAFRAASAYLHVELPHSVARLGARVMQQAPELAGRAQKRASTGRAVVERWLESEARVAWIPPTAGLTAMVRLPEYVQDLGFAAHLRERYDTQVVPGSLFEAPGYFRLSFGLEPQALSQALANITAALDDLA